MVLEPLLDERFLETRLFRKRRWDEAVYACWEAKDLPLHRCRYPARLCASFGPARSNIYK